MKKLLIIGFAVVLAACGPTASTLDGKYKGRGTPGSIVFHGDTADLVNGNGVVTSTMKYRVEGSKIKLTGAAFDLTIVDSKTIGSPAGYMDKQ